MRAVLLDANTLGHWQDGKEQNIDLKPLINLFSTFEAYSLTSPEQCFERCAGADVVITNKVVFDDSLLGRLPQLKAIQLAATGMNNIDLEAAKKNNISVFNVAGYSTFPVAQLTFQFILNFATRAIEHDQLVKQGAWQNSRMFTLTDYPTIELAGKTLLLLGHGEIGQKVEHIAKAFDMDVLIANIPGRPLRSGQVELAAALAQADFVSLHCPLSKETENIVNLEFLQQMKNSAYIINTARGPIINEFDLAKALKENLIAGAGLDVLCQEPPEANNPLLQQDVPNTIITPHIAWASAEAKQRLILGMANKIKDFIDTQF